MSKPTVRVLALLELLQSNGQLSGSELARRLEVDGRTLRRYIVALEELGIPISAERGRHGGYRLVAGFKLPPLMFSAEETLAVSLGLLAVRSLGLGESELALESAQAKLSRVMPVALRRRLVALRETASLDLARARAGTSVARWRPSPKPPRSVRGSSSAIATRRAPKPSANSIPTAWSIATAAGTSAVSATCARRCARSVSIAWTRRACWRSASSDRRISIPSATCGRASPGCRAPTRWKS